MLKQQQQQSVSLFINVSPCTLAGVRRSIHACDACSEAAAVPFTELLDRLTGHFDREHEYVLSEDVVCPVCTNLIAEDSLVELQAGKTAAMAANAWRHTGQIRQASA